MDNLYIHVPFCAAKCAYCAFYSVPAPNADLMHTWLKAVNNALSAHEPELMRLKTLYLGGGTPGFLPEILLEQLFDIIKRHCTFLPDAEKTAELNPNTVTPAKAALLTAHINRISMGVQSFSPVTLNVLGRAQGSPDIVPKAVEMLRNAGLRNLGFDLIFGAPGQTEQEWEDDLLRACELRPNHISAYALTPEEGTPFVRKHPGWLPDDNLSFRMWERSGTILAEHGMPRYEVSNYAARKFEAQHNQNVWHGETYLGIGPSASSFDGRLRWTEPANLAAWLSGSPPDPDPLPPPQRAAEILMMGLRTIRGWNAAEFEAVSNGIPFSDFRAKLERCAQDGLAFLSADSVRLTERGLAFWNDIAEELLN